MTSSSFVCRAARACIPGYSGHVARKDQILALTEQLDEVYMSANMTHAEAAHFKYALDAAKMQHSKAMVHAVVELINNAGKALQEAKANHAKCLEVAENQMRRVVDQAAKDKLEL
ncbi:hypothetical protein LPJ66_005837 [Kickxella alabastrina]|uniref:Uncharacterized protein n=1 Tax=Kickxella alabastrina TaxID=61397 RepID=A0ACC1IHR4_9FUNG|nr:hypothetical protein LPJ66_005837 [Kickxella alabastrina]